MTKNRRDCIFDCRDCKDYNIKKNECMKGKGEVEQIFRKWDRTTDFSQFDSKTSLSGIDIDKLIKNIIKFTIEEISKQKV